MAITSKSKIIAAKLEAVFNTEETLTNTETIEVKSNSSLEVSVETKQRDVIRNSMLDVAPIPIRDTVSGTIALELNQDSLAADDLIGDLFLEAGLGIREAGAVGTGCFIGFSDAGTTAANEIYEAQAGETGTGTLYKLSGTTAATKSLTIKEFVGGDKSVVTTGNVVESIKINIPTADIATIEYSIGGCGFTVNNADAALVPSCTPDTPFLGKSATYDFDGVALDATDVSIDITNDVYNVDAITASGYSEKIITKQTIKGSFKVLFTDYSLLTKFQTNTSGSLYTQLTLGTRKFAIYIPNLKLTSFSKSDDSGVIMQSVEFQVVQDCTTVGEPILIGAEA